MVTTVKKNIIGAEASALITMGAFGVVDFIDSFLIHLKEIASLKDPSVLTSCKIGSLLDCGAVVNSSYSHLFGIPVSLIGIIFAEAIFLLSIILLFSFSLKKWMKWILSLILVCALSFSCYLIFMSYFGLGVFCPYCLVSNVSTLMITMSWLAYLKFNNKKLNPNNEKN